MTPRYLQEGHTKETMSIVAPCTATGAYLPHAQGRVTHRCHRSCGCSDRFRIFEKLPEEKDRGLDPSSSPRGLICWPQPASLLPTD